MFALEQEKGNVKLLSTGAKEGWTTEKLADEFLCKSEVVTIPWGGTPNVKYYNGKFVTAEIEARKKQYEYYRDKLLTFN